MPRTSKISAKSASKVNRDLEVQRRIRIARDGDPLVQDVAPEELLNREVDGSERHADDPVSHDVGIREARGEPIGLVADRRAEEEGARRLEIEEPHREEARAFVVEPLLAETAWHDVAVVVEHAERVGVLEHPRAIVAGDGPREDVVRRRRSRGHTTDAAASMARRVDVDVLTRHARRRRNAPRTCARHARRSISSHAARRRVRRRRRRRRRSP